ncbi:MAG TPA: hypothetical protein VNF68_11815 [Candidatus Baltobacteraceae bacterium]|nr:hypothetical protein [Candidatus Baltobacteraceae bacterium]
MTYDRYRAAVAALFASVLVTSCSGGGFSPKASGAFSPAGVPLERVTVKIVVSLEANLQPIRPEFISPSTKSLKLVVKQSRKIVLTKTVNLTPTSTGCKTTLADSVCTLTLRLAAGSYAATASTYDAVGAKGKLLSLAVNLPFAVKAAGSNVIPLTLSGVPKSIVVGSDGSGHYYAEVRDADGNFIVGSGMPKLKAVRSGGGKIVAFVQPSPASPNEFSVVLAAKPAMGIESIGVVANYPAPLTNACKQRGAVCSFPNVVTATYGQTLILANYGNSNVMGFTLPLVANQAASFKLSVTKPYPLVLGPSDDLLVGAYTSAGPLEAFKPPYTASPATNTNGINDPYWIALDAKNDAFVANYTPNDVTEYAPPYTAAPITTISTGVNQPYADIVDSGGNLYVANDGNSTVTAYAPPYTGAPVTLTTTGVPYALVIRNNQLFVGESNAIDVFTLPVTSSSKPIVTNANASGIDEMAFDAEGDLFATEFSGGTTSSGAIVEFVSPLTSTSTPAVTISEDSYGSDTYHPYGLAFDRSGNLYVCNFAGGLVSGGINEYEPPFSNTSSPQIALNGTLFFQPYYFAITQKAALSTAP